MSDTAGQSGSRQPETSGNESRKRRSPDDDSASPAVGSPVKKKSTRLNKEQNTAESGLGLNFDCSVLCVGLRLDVFQSTRHLTIFCCGSCSPNLVCLARRSGSIQ